MLQSTNLAGHRQKPAARVRVRAWHRRCPFRAPSARAEFCTTSPKNQPVPSKAVKCSHSHNLGKVYFTAAFLYTDSVQSLGHGDRQEEKTARISQRGRTTAKGQHQRAHRRACYPSACDAAGRISIPETHRRRRKSRISRRRTRNTLPARSCARQLALAHSRSVTISRCSKSQQRNGTR